MRRKKIIVVVSVLTAIILIVALTFSLYILGAFDKFAKKDIASFKSPNGVYCLLFQQIGVPEFPYGKTDVRFILSDSSGNKISVTDTYILDDGANAGEDNIKSVDWQSDSVQIILRASEMEDKSIVIYYAVP